MKHPEELRTKFVELRARNVPYERISEQLGVSKPTLIQWRREMADAIDDLKAAEREMVKEKLLDNFEQWLGRQVNHFHRLDEEFAKRKLQYSPTESVFRMMMDSRKVLEKYLFAESPLDRPRQPRGTRPAKSAPPASDSPSIQHPEPEIENSVSSTQDQESIQHHHPESEIVSRKSPIENSKSPLQAPASSIEDPVSAIENHPQRHPIHPESEIVTRKSPIENSASSIKDQESATQHPQPKIENRAGASLERPKLAQLDPDDPNFYDESIVIEPNEPARSILQRYGVNLPARHA